MAHIRIKNGDKMSVNIVGADGVIKPYCTFVNKETPRFNMVSLCMSEHKNNNIEDTKQRAKYEKEIKVGFHGKLLMFEVGENTFITAPVTDDKGKVIWDAD